MNETLIEKIAGISNEPGVYLMKDADGKVIYVGKAFNLKKRLSSYFKNADQHDLKTEILITKISSFETIITGTEQDALILESNLIKRFRPKYNVILKDDKRYPSLRLDIQNEFPNLLIVRKTENDGALYFGPYSSPSAVYQTLKVIHKTFKLRKCKTKDFKPRKRPCLNYQMGACLAPCCMDINKAEYDKMVKEIILFLRGRASDLIRNIKQEMMAAAESQDFETAAVLRDRMFAIQKTLEKQVAITTDAADRDVLAIARSAEFTWVTLLFVRIGYLIGIHHFKFTQTLSTNEEVIGTFIRQYYEKASYIPCEILIPRALEDAAVLENLLKQTRGAQVRIVYSQKGEKSLLLKMAAQNAENALRELITSKTSQVNMLKRLQEKLRISKVPLRIECFDNSNFFGKEPVAGMVVFENAQPDKSSYRKYKVQTVTGPDDYASMAEILKRRYGKMEQTMPHPDLLMVDGGKGQLNIAVSVLKELNLDGCFDVIGIAKKDEKAGESEDKIYKPGRANPINFGREKDLLLFLQRIRDEAHRFAISFHRRQRKIASLSSIMDTIPGIGKKRKHMLLRHFGTVEAIRTATLEQLSTLPGISLSMAETIQKSLNSAFSEQP